MRAPRHRFNWGYPIAALLLLVGALTHTMGIAWVVVVLLAGIPLITAMIHNEKAWARTTNPEGTSAVSSNSTAPPAASMPSDRPALQRVHIDWERLRANVPSDVWEKLHAVAVAALPFEDLLAAHLTSEANPLLVLRAMSQSRRPLDVRAHATISTNKRNWASIEQRATALHRDPRTKALTLALMDAFAADARIARAVSYNLNRTLKALETWLNQEEGSSHKAAAWVAARADGIDAQAVSNDDAPDRVVHVAAPTDAPRAAAPNEDDAPDGAVVEPRHDRLTAPSEHARRR